MPVKIRLQRFGKKGQPYFHIVVADARASRDGRYIEQIGVYNPHTKPASIEIDNEKALTWLQNGALPTDTCRAILSYKGVLYRRHLQLGVAKGALTEEQANAKYEKWLSDKETKIASTPLLRKAGLKKGITAPTPKKPKVVPVAEVAEEEAPEVSDETTEASEPQAE